MDPNLEWKMSIVKKPVDPTSRVQREGGARQADEPQHVLARMGKDVKADNLAHTDRTSSATPATRRGRRVPVVICRSRLTRRPSVITTKAARLATSRPTTRRWRAMTCSCWVGVNRPPAARSRRCVRRRRWCCHRRIRVARKSTCSSRRSRRAATARRRSTRTIRTRSARPRRKPAPIAICRRTTTTTRSWRSCWRRERTSSTSSATTRTSAATARSAA